MPKAAGFILKELLYTLLLILGVTTLIYMLFNLMPGTFLGKGSGMKGYIDLLKRLLSFKFGISPVTGIDIRSLVFPAFKNTVILTVGSLFISVIISVPIGVFSAFRGFKSYSWPFVVLSYVLSSIPVFYFGYFVIYVFSRHYGYLPIYKPFIEVQRNPLVTYVLPIFVLGLSNESVSEIVRLVTNELNRVLGTDYVIASKARGENVLMGAMYEGILIPLISIVFSKVPYIIGGAVIVEYVFNWPGMGRLAFQSTLQRDLPVLLVIAFLAVLMVRAGMIVKDILIYYISPRET